MEKKVIFVYGTLRKHGPHHRLLSKAECVSSQCWTDGALFDTGNGYPAMVPHGNGRVYGELYRVTDQQLRELDVLEGYEGPGRPNLYERVEQPVCTDKGEVQAYVYVFQNRNKSDLDFIQSGDWKCHVLLERGPLHYFAYGSCMDDQRFYDHGVASLFKKMVGVGIVNGFSLRYTHRSAQDGQGRADLLEIGGQTEGKVYEINREALNYLFWREGVQSGAYRPTFVDVTLASGETINDALTFTVVHKVREEVAPPKHYALEIVRGGTGYLSESYLKALKQHLREKFSIIV